MASFKVFLCFSLLGALLSLILDDYLLANGNVEVPFDQNYKVSWGEGHAFTIDNGREIQLSMDASSGSGFVSKLNYGSGFFHMRIKLPVEDCAGVVTAYYLTSQGNKHNELDFEFLGNRKGKPYLLQTNVFVEGKGNREERLLLWFDPTTDFHSYQLLWNEHQIVFFVDNIPIRVFRNNIKIGVPYPSQAMQIDASLWNGETWATDGGQEKINWSYAPFKAHYQGFDINGCQAQGNDIRSCYSSKYWWNGKKYWDLDSNQKIEYNKVRKNYLNYDYCSDRKRHPTPPLECSRNSWITSSDVMDNNKSSKGQ